MKLHKNIKVWYFNAFFNSAAFFLPVWVIFNTEFLGLSNTQAYLLGVLPYGLSAVFEIPTRAWSDRFGRLKIFRFGSTFYILSLASYLIFDNFYILLVFQAIGALGLAMESGSVEALIHDSLPKVKRDELYLKIHSRKHAILFTSRVLAVLVGALLYGVNPYFVPAAAVATNIIGLGISFLFEDIRRESSLASTNYEHIRQTFQLMIKKHDLHLFLVLMMVYAFISEAMFGFFQPYLRSIDINVESFGIFYSVVSIISGLASLSISRILKKISVFQLLGIMISTVTICLGLFISESSIIALLAIIQASFSFGFITSLQNTFTQKRISSTHQATALSIVSFLRTGSFFISVTLLGLSLDYFSVRQVNIGLFAIGLCCLLLYLLSSAFNFSTKATGVGSRPFNSDR